MHDAPRLLAIAAVAAALFLAAPADANPPLAHIAATAYANPSLIHVIDSPNPQDDSYFGGKMATGDVDGDGTEDIAVGAAGAGRVHVFSGADASLIFSFAGADSAHCGSGIAAGDVSGDGRLDIVMGCPLETVGSNLEQGRAYVFSGSDGSLICTLTTPNPQGGALFGADLHVGDLNADGHGDIAASAHGETVADKSLAGRAYVFSGAECSPSLPPPSNAMFTFESPTPQNGGTFGQEVFTGDVDLDGRADVAISAPYEGSGNGRVYIFSGANGLLLCPPFESTQPGAQLGQTIAMGDLNGDGAADVVASAQYEQVGAYPGAGRAYVFSGSTCSPLLPLSPLMSPNSEQGGEFGGGIALADIDADGNTDVVVGAQKEDAAGSTNSGRAYAFSGVDGSLIATFQAPSPQAYSFFGTDVAMPSGGGTAGRWGLAISARLEDVGGYGDQGRVYVFCLRDLESDGDGFTDCREEYVGTDVNDRCADTTTPDDERGPAFGEPLSPWPTDINDDGGTNLSDILRYIPVFNSVLGDGRYIRRFDLNADTKIGLADVLMFVRFFNTTCTP